MQGPRRSGVQFVRFLIVGAASNVLLYVLYILATSQGIGHKTAMSVLYMLGVLQTFVANRSWSFDHRGRGTSALMRYLVAYLLAFCLNFGVMYAFVDRLGYSDKLVQGCMIVVVALLMFLAQKYWVFKSDRKPSEMERV